MDNSVIVDKIKSLELEVKNLNSKIDTLFNRYYENRDPIKRENILKIEDAFIQCRDAKEQEIQYLKNLLIST